MTLTEYLEKAGRARHEWSVNDCCTFAADWAVSLGYSDPMARWRGLYCTAEQAWDFIASCGGLVDMFTLGMIDAQMPEVDEPQRGDIGVLRSLTTDGTPHVGGIFTGKRWMMLGEPSGLVAIPQEWAVAERVWRP